ncbi:hypothetical protein WCLP8_2870009 [uncultured Gammaproteobacteria bacterium]
MIRWITPHSQPGACPLHLACDRRSDRRLDCPHGDTLFALETADGVAVAIKAISDRLGIDWEGQRQRMKRDTVLTEGTCIIQVQVFGDVQVREHTVLRLDLVNGWLFGIDENRVKPLAERG